MARALPVAPDAFLPSTVYDAKQTRSVYTNVPLPTVSGYTIAKHFVSTDRILALATRGATGVRPREQGVVPRQSAYALVTCLEGSHDTVKSGARMVRQRDNIRL